uniref:hypothetical protein n=1 Tax=Streptomyces sp. CA-141956 TaxID=3240051 RepID=UPI003F496201
MTLEELITALETADPTLVLPHGFTNPHSYRGFYEDLAFEPATDVRVTDMLADARDALGETFEGWKGGEYKMRRGTDCWLAHEGMLGETLGPLLIRLMLDAGICDTALHAAEQPATVEVGQPRITPDPDGDGAILHLPDITHLDSQAWAVDIGLTSAALHDLRALLHASPDSARQDTQTTGDEVVILPPTTQLAYRLEHRCEGETAWRQGIPGLGLRWTYAERSKADQKLTEARTRWPQYEHRMVTITTTVSEAVADGVRP